MEGIDIGVQEVEVLTDEERIRLKNSEVERLWASNDKARELLGCQPDYSAMDGFHQGLIESVEWFRKPENLAVYKSDLYTL